MARKRSDIGKINLITQKLNNMYYELKLKTSKTNSQGEEKEVAEHFITDVELFAEAEQKGLEMYAGHADVFSVTRSKIREIVNTKEKGKPFYKATIVDTYTDDAGNEKETKYYVLVSARDIPEANRLMEDYLRQGFDMTLDGIVKTKIIDLV